MFSIKVTALKSCKNIHQVTYGNTQNKGQSGNNYKKVLYMYSRSTGEWTRKEDVPYITWSSMCAVVRNKGKLEFVVAGGYTYSDGVFDDVAIFDVEENVWRRAQNRLPLPLYSGIALQFEDTFLVRIYNCQILVRQLSQILNRYRSLLL